MPETTVWGERCHENSISHFPYLRAPCLHVCVDIALTIVCNARNAPLIVLPTALLYFTGCTPSQRTPSRQRRTTQTSPQQQKQHQLHPQQLRPLTTELCLPSVLPWRWMDRGVHGVGLGDGVCWRFGVEACRVQGFEQCCYASGTCGIVCACVGRQCGILLRSRGVLRFSLLWFCGTRRRTFVASTIAVSRKP